MKLAGVDVNCKVLFRVKIFADLFFYFYYLLQNRRRFCEFRLQIWTCIKNELGIKTWSLPVSISMYIKSGRRLMVSPNFFPSKFFVASRLHWLFGCWYSQTTGFLHPSQKRIILLKCNFKTMQFFPTYFPFFYDE